MAQSASTDQGVSARPSLIPERWRRPIARVLRTLWLQATAALLLAYLVILPVGITAAVQQWRAASAERGCGSESSWALRSR